MKRLILASASPRRRDLLWQIGWQPEICPGTGEENPREELPEEMVKELSRAKCLEVAGKTQGEALVLGADTVVSQAGEVLGKPKDAEEAARMLKSLQGNTHQVFTGVTLAEVLEGGIGRIVTFAERTLVELYPMTQEEIQEYISTGQPFDKAGAYGIQGYFARYVKRIDGDYNNVVGLPVAALYQNMARHFKSWF